MYGTHVLYHGTRVHVRVPFGTIGTTGRVRIPLSQKLTMVPMVRPRVPIGPVRTRFRSLSQLAAVYPSKTHVVLSRYVRAYVRTLMLCHNFLIRTCVPWYVRT
jgi:hypothetical protein